MRVCDELRDARSVAKDMELDDSFVEPCLRAVAKLTLEPNRNTCGEGGATGMELTDAIEPNAKADVDEDGARAAAVVSR